MRKTILLMSAGLLLATASMAQRKKSPAPQPADTTKKPAAGAMPPQAAMNRGGVKPGPKPYNDVITSKAVTRKGMFTVHKVDDRFFFEIPDSLIARDVLVVSRISKSATGARAPMMMIGYGGDQINESVIRFDKGPDDRIFLKSISYRERSSDSTENGMYTSVMNSNLQPIAASFNVAAYNKEKGAVVIDVTDYLAGDNDIFFFDGSAKRALGLNGLNPAASYISEVKSFPNNVEIKTVKTYQRAAAPLFPGMPAGSPVPSTFELNTSLVLLPEVPMKPRYFDARVGYFSTGYTDFDANPQGVKFVSMITRWRLEPKPEDVEKYKRGELVEPQNPIVYYIDPATPKKWVPYLIAGVNDWQVAFEKAGFKNAIIAKEAPKDDSTWSVEDARHNVIVYKPSDIPNASGPHVHDPRSGEILETHINWYHNVMSLVRNWYLIQAAAIDPQARKMKFDDELMGQLIRFVSSHEVGHTLGLRHNYGSSSTVPVENLRNKQWVEANGHTPSIMDYARFNYVAQPEDNISQKGIFPRIGDYDIWAIEWGYKWKPEYKTAEEESTWLNKWIIERLGANKRLWFGTEMDRDDPRCQNEDLGDNAMKASAYGIKNLKRVLAGLPEWSKEENEGYSNLGTLYKELFGQFNRYMGHVTKNIGGVETTPKSIEQGGEVFEFTSKARQKEAMSFLQEQLFTTPTWILDKKIFGLTGINPAGQLTSVQVNTVARLLNTNTLNKLDLFEANKGASAYTSTEMLSDLKKGIWKELASRSAIDAPRRALQKGYVDVLISTVAPPPASGQGGGMQSGGGPKTTDATSLLKGHARSLMAEIKSAAAAAPNQATRLHLQDLADRLSNALDKK